MTHELQLRLLGNIEVYQDGSLLTGFRYSKSLALLCYLAVTGRSHSRSALVGLLWGDMPETSARRNLTKSLTDLRRRVEAHLTISQQTVAFNRAGAHWLDVEQFEARLGAGPEAVPVERLREAVELYRGDFLEGFYVQNAPEFEAWVLAQQARLRELALHALHRLADHYSQQGQAGRATAIDYTTRLLALEPWREEAHRQLMLLFTRSGQRSAALAQYKTCCQVLAEELGVEPDPETTNLYDRIRSGEVSRDAQGPERNRIETNRQSQNRHNLPIQTTPFIGRDAELAELTALLARPELRLITIVGPGGMGKTRLALELAATQLDHFEHGVYFVGLGPLESPEAIIPAIAEALRFSFYSGSSSPQEQLKNYLREKQVLLLMDNYEHLLDGVSVVVDLLKAAPGLKILVTSRARLNIREEQRFSIRGIDVPDELRTDNIEHYSAVKLFLESARRVRSDFALTAGDMAAAAQICRLVQGMPLALILAATWVEVLTPAEIAAELGRSLDFLQGNLRDLPERQQSIRAVFDRSWRLLTAREQATFRQMSVFRGGFTREAAGAVTGASLSILRTLVNKSFLHHNTSTGRYEMHELLRQYAQELLEQTTANQSSKVLKTFELSAVRDRHCAYYCAFLHQRETDLKGPRQQEALTEIEADGENVRAAWQWAVEREQIDQLGLALESLGLFYLWRSRLYEGEAICRLAGEQLVAVSGERVSHQVGPSARTRLQVRVLIWLSIFQRHLHEIEEAQQALRQAQTLLDSAFFIELDTRLEQAHLFLELAEVTAWTNSLEARNLVEQSLVLYRILDNQPWHMAQGLDLLGHIVRDLGQLDKARRVQEECLALRQALGNPSGIARSLQKMAGVARLQGQFEEAEALLHKCISIFRETGDPGQLAYGILDLGITLNMGGQFANSLPFFEESRGIYHDLGLPHEPGAATNGSGFALMHLGRYEEAQVYLEKGLKLYRKIDAKAGVGYALKNFGRIALAEGRYSEAQQLLQESITVFRSRGEMHGLGQSLGILGYIALRLNNRQQAQDYIRQNLQIAVESRMFLPTMTALTCAALLLVDQGEKERAVELYALALQHGHVANSHWFEDVAGRQIAAVAETLPPEVVAAAKKRGRARELWATAEALLVALDAEI